MSEVHVREGRPHGAVAEETVLAAILGWIRDYLEDPEISADDNFLDVGGNSMLAVYANDLALKDFGAGIDVNTLYDATLRETAADVARRAAHTEAEVDRC